MGKSILKTVVDLLNEGGVSAAPAQPERHMVNIQTAVAAVSIEKVDTEEGSVRVLIEVVGPMNGGAERCQKRALTVCDILSTAGAQCVQEKCSFDSRAALFCVPVTALFYGVATAEDWTPRAAWRGVLAGAELEYMTAFSAQQEKGEAQSITNAPWAFTLEEFFPLGAEETAEPQEPFILQIGRQAFSGCTWTTRQRSSAADGIRQVRKGIAVDVTNI